MGRILAIDYGRVRCGVAWTDPLRLSINPQPFVAPADLLTFVKTCSVADELEVVVLTTSTRADGTANPIQTDIARFAERLQRELPALTIAYEDEGGSSKEAMQHLIAGGVRRKARSQKGALDSVSAGIILERYLRRSGHW